MSQIEKCISCGDAGVVTFDSRPRPIGRMRRKRCVSCGHRWVTFEVVQEDLHGLVGQEAVTVALASLEMAENSIRELRKFLENTSVT